MSRTKLILLSLALLVLAAGFHNQIGRALPPEFFRFNPPVSPTKSWGCVTGYNLEIVHGLLRPNFPGPRVRILTFLPLSYPARDRVSDLDTSPPIMPSISQSQGRIDRKTLSWIAF